MKNISISIIYQVLLVIIWISPFQIEAQSAAFKGKVITPNAAIEQALAPELRHYQLIELDAQSIYDFVANQSSYLHFELAIEGLEAWNIQLILNELRSVNYQNVIRTSDGIYAPPEQRATTYKGNINNDEKFRVRMSIYEHLLLAMFNDNGHRSYLQPLSEYLETATNNQFVFYTDEDVIVNGTMGCGADHHNSSKKIQKMEEAIQNQQLSQTFTGGCMDIAVQADFQYCEAHGNLTAFYIDDVINMAEDAYESSFNITLKKVHQQLWHPIFIPGTSIINDPYSSTSASQILNEIIAQIQSLEQPPNNPINRDIAIGFTGKDIWAATDDDPNDFGVIGLARTSTACRNLTNTVGCLESFNTKAQAMWTLAHEIGHTVGGSHSDDGGIMNDSYNFTSQFSDNSEAEIQAYLDTNADCLECPCTGSCCSAAAVNQLDLATKRKIVAFAQENLHKNVPDLQNTFIEYQKELIPFFELKSIEKYQPAQESLAALTTHFTNRFALSFLFNHEIIVGEEDLEIISAVFQNIINLTKDEALKATMSNAQNRLSVMLDKELKEAIIAFDRTDLEVIDEDNFSLPQNEMATTQNEFFQLIQSFYANPILKYDLPQDGQLTIQLLDGNGRLVQTIANNQQVLAGKDNVVIETQHLSNGIYFLQATFSNDVYRTQFSDKVVVVK